MANSKSQYPPALLTEWKEDAQSFLDNSPAIANAQRLLLAIAEIERLQALEVKDG